jgi:hypothetical protein
MGDGRCGACGDPGAPFAVARRAGGYRVWGRPALCDFSLPCTFERPTQTEGPSDGAAEATHDARPDIAGIPHG